MIYTINFLENHHTDSRHFADHIVNINEISRQFILTTKKSLYGLEICRITDEKEVYRLFLAGVVMTTILWNLGDIIKFLERGHTVIRIKSYVINFQKFK